MISIIIPVYNDEKYINQCLDSVLNQTYTDFEVLCMDDGSTDNTVALIKEYLARDKRIKLFQNSHMGPGWQRNYGIESCTGDYVTFMDHDDFVDPTWLEKLYKTLTENNVDVAYCCNREYFEEENRFHNYSWPEEFTTPLIVDLKTIPEDLVSDWFAPWRRLVRRDFLIEHEIRFAVGKFKFDDVLFTEELLLNAKSLAFCNEVLYTHRMFRSSITGTGMVNKDIYFEHFDTIDELLKYCKLHDLDPKPILVKMFKFFSFYLGYVSSTYEFYKRLKAMVYENHLPSSIKRKLFIQRLKIFKRKLYSVIRKVK